MKRCAKRVARALCVAAVIPLQAAQPPSEYEVKAAFLLNFTRFVEWPSSAFADPSSPFAICVIGKNPFAGALEELLRGETVADRKLLVRRFNEIPPPKSCQIEFIVAGGGSLAAALERVGSGVLTVGDGDAFARDGGMIGFVIEDRRVRFDINRQAAETAGLKLSSRLLGVARSVIDSPVHEPEQE